MRQRTRGWKRVGQAAVLAALVGTMLGTAALAQFGGPPPPGGRFGGPPPPGDRGPGGMGRGMRGPRPATALTTPLSAWAGELKLTSGQQAKIAKIQDQWRQQRRGFMPPPGSPPPDPRTMGAAMEKMRGRGQAAESGILAVLTSPQKAALPGLLKTLDSLRYAGIPMETYAALRLTGSQKARITSLAQTSQQAMRSAMDTARQSGNFGALGQSRRGGRERLASQAAAVLTPAQRSVVNKYKAAHPRPAFGGLGGFGGPPPPGGGFGRPPGQGGFRPGERRSQADGPGRQDVDHGRPVALVARDLGVTPAQFRAAFRKVHPAGPGQEPTPSQRRANRRVLSESLGVAPERLDAVMDHYRPGGRGTNGPGFPPPEAPPPPPPDDNE